MIGNAAPERCTAPLAVGWTIAGRHTAAVRGSGLGVTYAVLGPLEATVDGRPARLGGPRARAVLAMLLLRAGQVVPAPALVDAVWGEHPPVSSANLLQGYVSDLRKELGRESIRTSDPGYRLTVAADAFDLRRFEKLAADGSAALTRGGLDEALARLGGALSLWRGPALADIIADHAVADGVVAACAARLEDMRLAVQERYAEALLATGDARQAAAELAHLIRTHPLREEPRALLMLALYRCGRQAEALEVFREGRSTLVAELGIEPGAALRDLEAAILRQDATLSLTAAPAATSPRAAANTNGSRTRTVLIGALDLRALPDLTAVARRLLQGTDQHELIIAGTVRDVAALHPSLLILEQYRTTLGHAGVTTRIAAFTSLTPGADLARLAAEQNAELLLIDAPEGLLEDARLITLLDRAPCDVAVLVAGEQRDGPVVVAFAGGENDWAAVELGAALSRPTGDRLIVMGALTGAEGRDASRMLANASLAVQRALGVWAAPLLVAPDPSALVEAVRDAQLVVVGLTERWRHEGVGRARTALATAGGHPTLLVRRGLRPGGLASRDAATRFTWTVAGGR